MILSFRIFGLLSLSLLLYLQRFDRCVFWPSSGVSCRTREPTRNFKPHPLFNPLGSLALMPLTISEYKSKYSCIVTRLQSGLNMEPSDNCHLEALETTPRTVTLCVQRDKGCLLFYPRVHTLLANP